MTTRLHVLLGGSVAGYVERGRVGWSLTYDEGWRAAPAAHPLSLAMPMHAAEHRGQALDAFVWGLLPDNATILEGWARRFHVSPREPFALLAHVGEECAGAVQPRRRPAEDGAAARCRSLGRAAGEDAHHPHPEAAECRLRRTRRERARLPEPCAEPRSALCEIESRTMAVLPTRKYESEGGPSAAQIVALLRAASSNPEEDVGTFVDALIFNWIIAGTDGHAKNYSLLHAPGGRVRLAPLYDLASMLPYEAMRAPGLRLAMRMGGEYRLAWIGRRRLERLGDALELQDCLARVARLCEGIRASSPRLRTEFSASGLTHPVIDRLTHAWDERAARCLRETRS